MAAAAHPVAAAYRDTVVDDAVLAFVTASAGLGAEVVAQASALSDAFSAQAAFLAAAGGCAKPASEEDLSVLLGPTVAAMTAVGEAASAVAPSHPRAHHLSAVGDSIGVLGWVAVDAKPVAHIADTAGAGDFYLNKVLMGAKGGADAPAAQVWVAALRGVVAALKAYVKEYHTQGLVWEFASKVPATSPTATSGGGGVGIGGGGGGGGGGSGFADATGEALAAYLAASKVLGGPIAKQADAFAAGFKAEGELLEKVAVTPKPADPASALQPMLEPIGAAMGVATEIGSSTSPRDPLFNHLTGVGESVGVLGWVAVDSKPVSYIGDMEGAGDFYLNKVLMGAKAADNKAAQQAWVRSVRALYAALKGFVKDRHTTCLMWNTGAAAAARGGGSAGTAAGGGGDDMGDAAVTGAALFDAHTGEALTTYLAASNALGGLVEKQATSLAAGFKAEAALLEKVSKTPKPSDPSAALQPMLEPIGAAMGLAAEIGSSTSPRDPLFNHLTGVGESVGVLGWVAVDSKPVSYIGDMEGAGDFYLNKVLMGAKTADNKAAQQAWVRSVRALYAALKGYVKANHTTCLMWNTGAAARASRGGGGAAQISGGGGVASTSGAAGFEAATGEALAAYLAASKALGGPVEKQATSLAAGFKAEGDLLEKVSKAPKPADPSAALQPMLEPIGAAMGVAAEIGSSTPPRDPLFNHLTGVGESVGVLGWVAVDSKPVSYIGDMEGAGDFYLNKVLMGAKTADNKAAQQAWVRSVRALYAALKGYVKDNHTTCLMWNTGAASAARGGTTGGAASAGAGAGRVASAGLSGGACFDALTGEALAAYLAASKVLGGPVEAQSMSLAAGFKAEAALLETVSKAPKPADPAVALQPMLEPIGAAMGAAAELGSSTSPRDPLFNHLTGVGESVGVLGWVAVDSKPVAYIGDMEGAGDFYLNKVLMGAKTADNKAAQQAWVRSVRALYAALKGYVKQYHTTCLLWNTAK